MKTYKLVVMLETDESATDTARLEDLFERMILEAELCRHKACDDFGEPQMSIENGETWSLVFGEVKVDDPPNRAEHDDDKEPLDDSRTDQDPQEVKKANSLFKKAKISLTMVHRQTEAKGMIMWALLGKEENHQKETLDENEV